MILAIDAIGDALNTPLGKRVLATLGLLVLTVLLRWLVRRTLVSQETLEPSVRLRWVSQMRGVTLLVAVLGLTFIWGAELRDFLLSLVVLASAVVLATKELIASALGSFMRAVSRGFAVGDRIELGAHRGDVINIGLFTTTLLETGPTHQRTGRTIVLPNSMFLTNPIANETFTDAFVLHTFTVPLAADVAWIEAEEIVQRVANETCQEYTAAAKQHMDAISAKHGLGIYNVEPRVSLVLTGSTPNLQVRVPTPARDRGRVEQEIIRAYLNTASSSAS